LKNHCTRFYYFTAKVQKPHLNGSKTIFKIIGLSNHLFFWKIQKRFNFKNQINDQ